MTTENQSNNFFNLEDLINTLRANNALGLKRVHDGTDNDGTVSDLLDDVGYALYELGGLDKQDWDNLQNNLKTNN